MPLWGPELRRGARSSKRLNRHAGGRRSSPRTQSVRAARGNSERERRSRMERAAALPAFALLD
eukprot:1509449-Alexandrium_andersonii.AAC.1